MKEILLTIVIGYLLGNMQASYLLGKLLYKIDIRTLGHGNAGASNALSSVGFKFGLYVAIVDVLKGVVAIVLTRVLFSASLSEHTVLLYISTASVMLGHIFPFYMNFKGGKGTATLLGALLGIQPLLGVGAIVLLILLTFILDYVALSAVILMFLLVVLTLFMSYGVIETMISIGMFALSLYLHSPNFKRIINKTEGRLSLTLKSKRKER